MQGGVAMHEAIAVQTLRLPGPNCSAAAPCDPLDGLLPSACGWLPACAPWPHLSTLLADEGLRE